MEVNKDPQSDDEIGLDYFDSIREQLRYWPHTLHQIEDTLDIGLIEGRGKQQLFQAINSQNLQAFAGAGLSMSYGRLSWLQWEKEQTRVVARNAKEFCTLAQCAISHMKTIIAWVEPKHEWEKNKITSYDEHEKIRNKIRSLNEIERSELRNIYKWLKSCLLYTSDAADE